MRPSGPNAQFLNIPQILELLWGSTRRWSDRRRGSPPIPQSLEAIMGTQGECSPHQPIELLNTSEEGVDEIGGIESEAELEFFP